MIRISSSATLIFALFIPLFWLVFFGSLTIAILFASNEDISFSSPQLVKLFFICGFIIFGTLIYFTLFRLKRVEMDQEFIYVTNYIKTIKIPFHQMEKMRIKPLIKLSLGKIKLRHKGYFGRNIYFLCDEARFLLLEDKMRETSN